MSAAAVIFVLALARSQTVGTSLGAGPTDSLANVYLRGAGEWQSLADLASSSWRYLESKTNLPKDMRDRLVISIDRQNTNELARISFGGELGKQFWEVVVALDGSPCSCTNGIVVDVHRTSGSSEKR